MKKIYRRERQQFIFGGILAAVALANVLFLLILYEPARSEYHRMRDSIDRLRGETAQRRANVARFEKLSAQLESSDRDRRELFTSHFIPRGVGWSEIIPELDALAVRAGVRKSRVEYSPELIKQYGLYSVKIRIPVQGSYQNVVNFMRGLENSRTFYIINTVDVRGESDTTGQPAAGPDIGTGQLSTAPSSSTANIALALTLETFFYQ